MAVSDYFDSQNRNENPKFLDFEDYLDSRAEFYFSKVLAKHQIDGKTGVDKVIRFEHMESDLRSFARMVGLPEDELMKDMNICKIHGKNRKSFEITEEQKRTIGLMPLVMLIR